MGRKAEPILQQQTILGEGACWYDPGKVLYWVDILGQKLFVYDPSKGDNRTFDVGADVGTVAPRTSGGVLLAVKKGFASLDLNSGAVTMLKEVEAELPGNRFNDGKCDPMGRFWAGTMGYDWTQPASGALYVLEKDLSVRKVLDGIACPNGFVWTADGKTMYFSDSMTYEIHGYDYAPEEGQISNRRIAVSVSKDLGLPDGMAIDTNDNIWVAMYGTGLVCCWNPRNGRLLDTVEVPGAMLTTSCAFGGPKLHQMFITSATNTLSSEDLRKQPNAGALFMVELGVKGASTFSYQG